MKIYLLLISVLFLSNFSFTQEAIIGSGITVNTTTQSSPVNIWYRRTLNQMVYTVAELNAAGINTAGDINDLGFYVTQSPIYDIPGYTIKIKHTTVSSAYYNFGNSGWTTVKNAFTHSPISGGWDMFNFDTPFVWDGINNIVIQICWSQVAPNYNASGQCRVFNANSGYAYKWTDASGNSCGEIPNANYNTKPQIKFIFDTLTVWTGTVSTDWNNINNWTKGIPTQRIDAKIPVGTPNNPNVISSVNCDELILEGAIINGVGGVINITRHFTNSGAYTDNGGAIHFISDKISNLTSNSAVSIADLIIEKPNSVSVLGGNTINITHEIDIIEGGLITNNNVTIKSDANGTGRIAELKAKCSYTLDMQDSWGDGWNGGFVTVNINGVSIGDFSATGTGSVATFEVLSGSTIELVYTSGNWEIDNTYDLIDPSNSIIFSDGINPTTGSVYTTTSNCSFSGALPIQGHISMERYIDAGETYWRFFSSAVQGATILDYQDDFTTAGYTGSPFPGFGWVSIYTYDETLAPGLGYVPVANSSQVLGVGQGIEVWSGDTITGTMPFTVDLHGVPNQGDITLPVTYTSTGTVAEDGWNLIGNPYPSTIDWDSPDWTKTNIANAIQILNPDSQQYATYVNGASANGGSRFIASQQAFWVYASASAPSLIAKESVKSANDVTFFKSGSISAGMTIKLDGFGMSDECVLRHVEDAIDDYELDYDAYKLYGGWGTYPNISLINTTQEDLTVHSFDKQFQEWEIPVKVIVFANGFYDITFSNISELDVPCLKLEDTYTGQIYPISEGNAINIELSDTTTLPRFKLLIGKNYEVSSIPVSCYGGNTGEIQVELETNSNIDYVLTSSNDIVNSIGNANPLLITGLEAGTYSLEIPSIQNLCNQTNFDFHILSPSPLSITAIVSDEMIGGDGEIEVNVNGGTQPYSYSWNNGVASSDNLNLTEGEYVVTITDANNCIQSEVITVQSFLNVNEIYKPEFTVEYHNIINGIQIKGLNLTEGAVLRIYTINGEIVESFSVLADTTDYLYLLKKKIAKGVYIVKVNNLAVKFVN